MCFHSKSPRNLSITYQRTFARQSTILAIQFFFIFKPITAHIYFNQDFGDLCLFEFQKKFVEYLNDS